MDFATALEKAISLARRRMVEFAVTVTVLCVAFGIVGFVLDQIDDEYSFVTLVIAVSVWPIALSGTAGSRVLMSLRGSLPEHWLPSPSHGVVVLMGDSLVAGDLKAEFARHAPRRIASVAFDDSDHTLLLALRMSTKTDDGGERHRERHLQIKLDPSVSAEQASTFVKQVAERTR